VGRNLNLIQIAEKSALNSPSFFFADHVAGGAFFFGGKMDLIAQQTHLKELATTLAKSTMIPAAFRAKPIDAFVVILQGQELGLSPMQSLNSIVVIQGKPTLSAQLMLALCRAKIKDFSLSVKQEAESVTVTGKRGDDSFESTWGKDKAAAMGLLGKDNYKKQLVTMLRWRAISEVCRVLCPDVLMGVYATEEFQDLEGEVIKIEPKECDVEIFHQERKEQHPEKYELGNPDYEVANGKFRGKALKDIEEAELIEYFDTLEARIAENKGKAWELELASSISMYLESING
jgi:hypothetical protein